MSRWVAATFVLVLVGCDGTTTVDDSDGGSDSLCDDAVDYHCDVRPILVENCTMCHTEGGIAPFGLETYEQVSEVGDRVVEATGDRIMPPFLADNSGECNTWSNHRGLTDAEIQTLADWVATGQLRGDPAVPAPTPVEAPTLPSVDLTLEMPSTYAIDESDDDDYRCFVVEPGLTDDTFVTGYDVHPGNPERVHHVIVYNPEDEAAGDSARAMDTGDGYPCFGGPVVNASPLVLWAPGAGATTFPRGTGVQVVAGQPLVIQVHYNNLVPDSPNDDRTTIELSTRSSALQAYILPLADTDLNLPPRMEEVVETYGYSLSVFGLPADLEARVYGAFPHMHTLGRSLRVEIDRADGTNQCVIDVPRWDFNWQLAYWLDEPIDISASDRASITCTYNTMSRDETVHWGDGTLDEMCLNFVYVTLAL